MRKSSKPQRTISFDQDIYDFIEENRDRIKFSDYVNQLLSDRIKQLSNTIKDKI